MPDFSHAREIVEQFDGSSAIDVLLIAFVIFWTVRLLSGTRAMTQLRGALLLLLVAVLLGRMFDLTVVNFLVRNSFPALVIGAAIIFQPELRRGLDRIGRTGLQGWLKGPRHTEVIDSLVRATSQMARDRHGGLFVIERETGLQDVIETGVPVDARVSPELLAGIFFPNSPLHDMATVLRGDRVVAAGCVLPLASELPRDGRGLGTRHRAAIGITEQTDALSIVVSEETGVISVGLAGRLTHVANERRLRAVLEWLLETSAAARAARNGQEEVPA
ncbi:MAG: TIGR00159 family protein [Thermoflexaceae bacterium]|nr:TIGR00159 family protein [Thermoflexaceae bacterium]